MKCKMTKTGSPVLKEPRAPQSAVPDCGGPKPQGVFPSVPGVRKAIETLGASS